MRRTIVALMLTWCASVCFGQCEGRWLPIATVFPGVDGNINTSVEWDPDGAGPMQSVVVIGGFFSSAGPFSGSSVAQWNGSTWSMIGSLDGVVTALAVDSSGRLIAARSLSTVGYLSRWTGTSWQTIGQTNIGGNIQCLLPMPNGDIYVGGKFLGINSANTPGIARWEAGDVFRSLGSGIAGGTREVRAMARLPSGGIAVGGNFTSVGAIGTRNLARWDPASSQWAAMATTLDVYSLVARSDTNIVIGASAAVGVWSGTTNWVPSQRIVRSLVARPDGSVIVTGPTFAGEISVLPPMGAIGTLAPFANGLRNPSGVGDVFTACAYRGDVFFGGYFDRAGSLPVANAAIRSGGSWVATGVGTQATPVAAIIRRPDGELLLGGSGGVLRWNGVEPAVFAPPAGNLMAMAQTDTGDLYVGGQLTPFLGVARWSGTNWVGVNIWNSRVNALAPLAGGEVVAAGSFNLNGSVFLNNIARWVGFAWAPMEDGIAGQVNALTRLGLIDACTPSACLPKVNCSPGEISRSPGPIRSSASAGGTGLDGVGTASARPDVCSRSRRSRTTAW